MSDGRAVVFDLDGTLIDSLPDLAAAVNRLLRSEGLQPMERAEVRSYVGDGAPVLMRRVMAARGMDPARHAAITARMVADYTLRSSEATTVYPHVAETLGRLRANGWRLGICTNKPGAPTLSVLRAYGLDGYFSAVVAGDTLAERKPDPTPLRHTLALLGTERAAYVGDSEVDAATAGAAALPFALFTEGYLRVPRSDIASAAEFSDFRELPEILRGIVAPA